jgi:Ca2+-transporting ATPase
MLFEQLTNFMILILIAVAIISGFIGGITDTIIILIIIIVNAAIGFIQEYKAEKAMEALRSIIPNKTRLLEGNTFEIPSANLVPGDLIYLKLETGFPLMFVLLKRIK